MTKIVDIAMEQELTKFKEVGQYQAEIDQFCQFGAKVCQYATKIINNQAWPIDASLGEKQKIIIYGKCLREDLRDDTVKIYNLMQKKLYVRFFTSLGEFHYPGVDARVEFKS